MALYRDTGVVLRVQKLGEADRIVTMLTRRHGRVRAVAKGVRRTRRDSVRGWSRSTTSTCSSTTGRIAGHRDARPRPSTPYGAGLVGDYPRYTAGERDAGDRRRLTAEEGEPALRLYLLLVGALRALSAGSTTRRLVLDAFLLRAMATRGLGASDQRLRRLRRRRARTAAFSVAGRRSGLRRLPPARRRHASPETLVLLDALLHGRLGASRTRPSRRHRREASGLVAAHLQWHLERGLRSLPLVERASRRPDELEGRRTVAPCARRHPAPVRRPAAGPAAASWCRATWRSSWTATAAGPRSAGCRAPRATSGARRSLFDVVEGAIEIGRAVPVGVRLLHRELEALARRGALPDGLQPRRDPPPPRRAARAGGAGALGGPPAAAVEAA